MNPSQIAVDEGKKLYDWLTSQPLIRSQMTVEVLGKIIMHYQILIDKVTEESQKEQSRMAITIISLRREATDERERAEKAEAACAQMREALEYTVLCHKSGGAVPIGMILEALSTTCGKGYVSIEEVKQALKDGGYISGFEQLDKLLNKSC